MLITFQHVYSNQELTNTYHEGTAYYEIFIRSFADSDGDGIGDLNGIIQKLDYLQDLGIHGIWLTPFNPSPTYHKYDIIDYASVDQEYGTIEDIKKLLKEAHKRDIKIIMDFVVNHTSSKHPWFLDALHNPSSPYRDYYLWADESESHRWESKPYNPGLPWQWHKIDNSFKQKGLYYGFFWREMPDLNYDNAAVKTEMFKVSDFWLNKGVDGFRLDAIKYLDEDGSVLENTPSNFMLLQDFNASYKKQIQMLLPLEKFGPQLHQSYLMSKIIDSMLVSNLVWQAQF
jgi:glycosidase